MTSMPSRSQASSIATDSGLCVARIALNPAALSSSTRRSSARPMAAAPNGPVVVVDAGAAEQHRLAVDPQAPVRVDLDRPDAERGPGLRLPVRAVPAGATRVLVAAYRCGVSTLQHCGSGRYARCRTRAVSPGARVTGVSSPSTGRPLGSVTVVVRVAVVVARVRLTTRVATSTTACSGSTSSVVTRTPSGTMCTGSSTCSTTGRWIPQPEYQRESCPDRTSTRTSLLPPSRR